MNEPTIPPVTSAPEALACAPDRGFVDWLAQSGGSLLVSTYQAGKVLLLGWNGRQLTLLPRHFDKPMGLDVRDDRLLLATRHALSVFANAAPLAYEYREPGRYDALYLPRVTYQLSELHVHDVALTEDGIWMVNTRFSCLASPSDRFTFVPRWQPPFISALVPEDRCHLNGLALVDGQPGYVTALGTTDTVGGWRDNKAQGGVVIHIDSGEILVQGLAMPHSPRWHRGTLWFLHSGAGELVQVDTQTGTCTTVCRLPGYLRGLTLVGDYAVIGLCKIRETQIFGGMPIQERYPELRCGVAIVDLRSGAPVGMLTMTAGCTELYDIRFLAGSRRPNLLNLDKPELKDAIAAPGCYYWLRPDKVIPDEPGR